MYFLKYLRAEVFDVLKIKWKLSLRLSGPFELLDRVGEVSYRLALPPQLLHVHNVFHVSLLRGYKYHPPHVVSYPLDQIREDLSLVEEPEKILDRQERVMRNKTTLFVKNLWKNHPERKATWETKESMIRTLRFGSCVLVPAFCLLRFGCVLLQDKLRFATRFVAFCFDTSCDLLQDLLRFASRLVAFCFKTLAFCLKGNFLSQDSCILSQDCTAFCLLLKTFSAFW
nr:hypothetical protein [Tanacetum cinerariifolium]